MKDNTSESAVVVSAVAMDLETKTALAKLLKSRFAIDAPIEYKVDKKVLAGFTVTYKAWFLDASIQRELSALKRKMLH